MVVLKEQKCQTCNSRSSYLPLRQGREYMVEIFTPGRTLVKKKSSLADYHSSLNREGWVGGCCRRGRGGRRRQILPVAQLPDPPLLSRNWLN